MKWSMKTQISSLRVGPNSSNNFVFSYFRAFVINSTKLAS
jgi:hypothetical protein